MVTCLSQLSSVPAPGAPRTDAGSLELILAFLHYFETSYPRISIFDLGKRMFYNYHPSVILQLRPFNTKVGFLIPVRLNPKKAG